MLASRMGVLCLRYRQNGRVRLTVLGTSTPYPRPGNPCSGYLMQSELTNLWMDAGTGTLAELQRHIGLADLHGIWISHTHADHTADLLTAYYALRFGELEPRHPIPLIAPPGLVSRLRSFLGGASAAEFPKVFEVVQMRGANSATVGDVGIAWRRVQHGMPAFGARVAAADATLAYSGDSAPCDELVSLAEGSTAFLCEVGARTHEDGEAVHSTPAEAGDLAARARAGRLIITHVGDGMSEEYAAARAGATYSGPIDIARPGGVHVLG